MKPGQREKPDGGKGAVRPERPKGRFHRSENADFSKRKLSRTRP
jgi:hypothetical protein